MRRSVVVPRHFIQIDARGVRFFRFGGSKIEQDLQIFHVPTEGLKLIYGQYGEQCTTFLLYAAGCGNLASLSGGNK